MTKRYLLLAIFTISLSAQAQKPIRKPTNTANDYAAVDKIALQLPVSQAKTTQDIADYVNAHFSSNTEKARAIFIWTASNISYDADNMFALNFHENRQDKIDKVLKTHKGICENYATIFNDVALKCGIHSFVIEGYTKYDGFVEYLPHAWCGARIDNTWYLFDPTWGSGYLSKGKFVKKINNYYFKVKPASLISSHMPFDPMWEFLDYPITSQEFYDNKIQNNDTKHYFNYSDSIAAYEKEDETEQMKSEARRIEDNGVKNSLIYNRLAYLTSAIEVNIENKTVSEFNSAAADYNDGINLFNKFINYYNNQFKPTRPDAEIQQMIDAADIKLASANMHLDSIHHANAATIALMNSLRTSLSEAQLHVDEQKEFVAKYMDKGKLGRAMMFRKYTWMGMPVK